MKVTIIGRTNVGKSTLFNKISGQKQAMISGIGGTTRDVNKSEVEWVKTKFFLYDTAGLDIDPTDAIEKEVIKQSEANIAKADLLIFLLDGQERILQQDRQIAKKIRKLKIPVILTINKIDNQKIRSETNSFGFEKLGLKDAQLISASSGVGVGDLLDKIIKELKKIKKQSAPPSASWRSGLRKKKPIKKKVKKNLPEIKVAIIGKPNVGKSSILNALIKRKIDIKNQENIIVTNIPHTTREPQKRKIETKNFFIHFIDTAGVRRKSKIDKKTLELLSVRKSIEALKEANIVLFVIDASSPITSQDKKLADLIQKNNNGLIIIANKWDLIKNKTTESGKIYADFVKKSLCHVKWAPIILTSATEGRNITKIIDLIEEINQEQNKKIDQEELDKLIKSATEAHYPIKAKGFRRPKIYELKQIKSSLPKFVVVIGHLDTLHYSYLRFIENRLREKYDFKGTAIEIVIKNRK
ncbi:MAG: ribosome biogenesis GTPase Der [Patescibacteria group bacterium]|nr:ribosome biogenesis GTPase Der [Patescibacteria group bacterium]